jgi:hypothetical protein
MILKNQPNSPIIGQAILTGSSTASVSFTAPVSDGGSPIISYKSWSTPAGGYGILNQSGSGIINISGLKPNISYTFVVQAENADGRSTPSQPSNSVTTGNASVPNSPTINTATVSGDNVIVSFTRPFDNGGSIITSYTAISTPDNITTTIINQQGIDNITVIGLRKNIDYTFKMYATNSLGNSVLSNQSNKVKISKSKSKSKVPDAPTIKKVLLKNKNNAFIYINPPKNTGSSKIVSYTAVSTPGNKKSTIKPSKNNLIKIHNLKLYKNYKFRVYATNKDGNSKMSNFSKSISTDIYFIVI